MTDEDRTAAKLRGFNCLVKFKDGEELLIKVDSLDGDHDEANEWFMDIENFINGSDSIEYCPIPGLAVARDTIKYAKQL